MVHTPDSKQGVRLGVSVLNPVTGATLPVFAAPYVLSSFGSGAVMGARWARNRWRDPGV